MLVSSDPDNRTHDLLHSLFDGARTGSGEPCQLLAAAGIDATGIAAAARALLENAI
jgi:hypothetical protein